MPFCLPKQQANKLLTALKDGSITPEKLTSMTTAQRRKLFSNLVGEDSAKQTNALFEKTILLKNQKAGMVTWAKNITGLKEPAKRDLISKIERLDEVLDAKELDSFLEDLASMKLGTDVTFEEAKMISKLSQQVSKTKDAVKIGDPIGSPARIKHGTTKVALTKYVDDLKLSNNRTTLSTFKTKLVSNPGKLVNDFIVETAGFAKSIVASIDNSFWFRQGLKGMVLHPKTWFRNFGKSWKELATQISRSPSDSRIIDATHADLWSRPLAMNGTYGKAKLDIGVVEEAFPSSIPTRVPFLGRFFKASETAYESGAHRMRADIFDTEFVKAQKAGVDITDKTELESLGKLVNSMTGRGHLGKAEVFAKEVNVTVFSGRNLKSQFDFLTAHQLDGVTPYVRKEAAKNLIKVSSAIATTLAMANQLKPGSVELDPTSADFGKIRIGDTRFDTTGGLSSMVTMVSRLARGESKSSTTGKVTELNSGKFGSMTKGDVMWNFATNKLSPTARAFRDYFITGHDFKGEEVTVKDTGLTLITPIMIDNIIELSNEPNSANIFVASLLDAMGVSTNTY